jgi:hypothetical protein
MKPPNLHRIVGIDGRREVGERRVKVGAPKSELVTIRARLVAQSSQLKHVLVEDEAGRRYAVNAKAAGQDWPRLRKGQLLELKATDESISQVLTARILSAA